MNANRIAFLLAFALVLAPTLALAEAQDAPPPASLQDSNRPGVLPEQQSSSTVLFAPQSPAPTTSLSTKKPKTRWYGWQTLIADGTSFLLLLGASKFDSDELGYTALGTYALASPAIHLGHGHVGKAGASLGLRVGLPVGFGLAGAVMTHKDCSGSTSEYCGLGEGLAMAAGVLIGMAGAVALDNALIAREPVEEQQEARLIPLFATTRSGAVAGVAGTF